MGRVMLMRRCESPAEELAAYLGLKPEEISQIVLLLLVEEGVQQRLRALLPHSEPLPVKPAA